jgi:hypothetical protein
MMLPLLQLSSDSTMLPRARIVLWSPPNISNNSNAGDYLP